MKIYKILLVSMFILILFLSGCTQHTQNDYIEKKDEYKNNFVEISGKLIGVQLKNYHGWSSSKKHLELEITLEMIYGDKDAVASKIINGKIINIYVFNQVSNNTNWGNELRYYFGNNVTIMFKYDALFDFGYDNKIYSVVMK